LKRTTEASFEKGKDLLKKYYEKNKDNRIKHVALERSFSIRISGTKLNGRIDRMTHFQAEELRSLITKQERLRHKRISIRI
jgi:RecB family exonuclease